MANDLYGKINELVTRLNYRGYSDFANKVAKAKVAGSMGSEILGMLYLALNEYDQVLQPEDGDLKTEIKQVLTEISIILR